MKPAIKTIKLSQVVFDESLYPRKDHDPATVQRYEAHLEEIEARQKLISVATDMTLLDGRHRQLAYMKRMRKDEQEDREIQALVYPVVDRSAKYALACELNSEHGLHTTEEEKKRQVIRLWSEFGFTLKDAAKLTSARYQKALDWTARARKDKKKRENEKIFEMWLACHAERDIAENVGLARATIIDRLEKMDEKVPGNFSVHSQYREPGWSPPLYNVWKQQTKSNKTSHFGNSEASFLDRLLYLYTKPFDIVIDPFGGGGSTIDVCKKRLRRYWVSDRLPIVERRDIRQFDIADGSPPLHKRWKDVKLLYLDPPYWKQAEGEYSKDSADLANMELDEFHRTLSGFIADCGSKMHNGSHIAMLMQPTQWRAPGRRTIDHAFTVRTSLAELDEGLTFVETIQCPYESQQANAQQVTWAKENKRLLELGRTITVWEVVK